MKIHTKYKLIIHGYFILIKFLFKHSSFNQNVEKESGGGVINMTTIMVSQEIGDGAVKAEQNIKVEKTSSRVSVKNTLL